MVRHKLPKRGSFVFVRQRQYLVDDVVPSPGEMTLVRLSCVQDDAQGQTLEVLWEAELDARPLESARWDKLSHDGFDPPQHFASYLHTLQWNCVTATDPTLFQSPFRAGIHLDAYQLEPLRKALLLPRVNLFIADDVGLGKTIEAGLILRELMLRKKIRNIVIAAPPSVLPQWQLEMENRFGLPFIQVDKDFLIRTRRERGFSTNPWRTHSRFIISHRLLIDEYYTEPLRQWLGEFAPGSMLVVDEAHHIAPASGSQYAIDSQLTKALRDLSPRFEHRLFLSATPHNGHSNSFSALLEILDPQRFLRGLPIKDPKLLDAVMVRRLKEDLRAVGQPGFPQRKVVAHPIRGLPDDAPELVLAALLDEYQDRRAARFAERAQGQTGIGEVAHHWLATASVLFHRSLCPNIAGASADGRESRSCRSQSPALARSRQRRAG
ncbi:MAG: SNF2-related protein [Gemmatales bacterium]